LPFEKIFWLYTENELDAERMYSLVFLIHLQEALLSQGYKVYQVNSFNAYDFISNQNIIDRISGAIQRTKIDEKVHNLLKLALLAEHGGLLIDSYDTVLAKNTSWIEGAFAKKGSQIWR
jgi:hypothetical protein